MCKSRNVNSACGNICCNKNFCFPASKSGKDFFPLGLSYVSVQGSGFVALFVKNTGNVVCIALCLCEYNAVKIVRNVNKTDEGIRLFRFA